MACAKRDYYLQVPNVYQAESQSIWAAFKHVARPHSWRPESRWFVLAFGKFYLTLFLSSAYTMGQPVSLVWAPLLWLRDLGMLLPLGTNSLFLAIQLPHLYRDWSSKWDHECSECRMQTKSIGREYFYYNIVEKAVELGSSSNSATSYDLEQVMILLEPYAIC